MVTGLDHLVLTVTDISRSVDFYTKALGMEARVSPDGRHSLHFGTYKINLHEAGNEFLPHAASPVPGSADLCFLADAPISTVISHLNQAGFEPELGPVDRTGARGPMRSVYLRDPDHNLLEIAVYT